VSGQEPIFVHLTPYLEYKALDSAQCHSRSMLSERSDLDRRVSTSYCQVTYGHYGLFATITLNTAVINSELYDWESFRRTFASSGENHRSDPQFAEYMDSLVYEGNDYFTTDEIRFLLRLSASLHPLSDEQIELDLKAVTTESKRGRNMLKSHARILLKAILYWKMHFNDNYERWLQENSDANEAWMARIESGQDDKCQYFYCRECEGELWM
jgi:hypothetical protein